MREGGEMSEPRECTLCHLPLIACCDANSWLCCGCSGQMKEARRGEE